MPDLSAGLPTHPDLQKPYRLTVATLAREARVGRNVIYTNHRPMIEELRRADNHRIIPDKLAAWEDKLAEQRSLIQVLQLEERRLVTENAVLLKRILEAEAEAAKQNRRNARLIAERDQALKPTVLVPRSSGDVCRCQIQKKWSDFRGNIGCNQHPNGRVR
jgi:hypothetical protein